MVDLDAVVERLERAGCVAAREEAEAFVAAAPDAATLESWLVRRADGEPPSWITGTFDFCGRTLRIDPGVYVPRVHSEELARRAAAVLPLGGSALDLCTGSGAVAAHLMAEVPTASVIGVDLDPAAAACARRNGVAAVAGDLAGPIRSAAAFDVVTAVAPYVPTGDLRLLPSDVQRHEPRAALDGGPDGLHVVRRVLAAAAALLRPGGWVLVDIGGEQDDVLGPTFARHGFIEVTPWHDEEGDLRGIAARRPG